MDTNEDQIAAKRRRTVVVEVADPVLVGPVSAGRARRRGHRPLSQEVLNHRERGQTLTGGGEERRRS